MSLEVFCQTLAASPRPTLHRSVWRERLGASTLDALERAGLLVEQGRAAWFPCAGDCAGPDQRLVHPEPVAPGQWRVECPSLACPTVEIDEADLVLLSASPGALVVWLRGVLGATGEVGRGVAGASVEGLGQVSWEGEAREAFLALGGPLGQLRRTLEERERMRRGALVLAPSLRGLDASIRLRHAPGGLVVLVALGEVMAVHGGQLRGRATHVTPTSRPRALPEASVVEPLVAEVIDASGVRSLPASAYRELVARRDRFDLFLDLTVAGERRGYLARVRHEDGVREVNLAAAEASVLVELIRARRALRVGELRSVSTRSMGKLVERARRLIEGEGRRGQWRFVQTLSGVEPSAKRFVFQPRAGLTYAVLVPLVGEASNRQ